MRPEFQGILTNWSSQCLNQLHAEREMSMCSVSSTDLFRIQTKLVMKVRDALMKINNRALRILNNWTGNMRMIDAAMVTKALLRKENSQCYYGEWEGQWTTYWKPKSPLYLLGKNWRQLIPNNEDHSLAFFSNDLDAILFWKTFKNFGFS